MRLLIVISFICFLASCSTNTPKDNTNQKGALVHTVILKLKDSTSESRRAEIIKLLDSLKKIEVTQNLYTAIRAETPDPRAKTDYDIILQMTFNDIEELVSYSEDPFHLDIRKQLKDDLSEAPVVYDYWVN